MKVWEFMHGSTCAAHQHAQLTLRAVLPQVGSARAAGDVVRAPAAEAGWLVTVCCCACCEGGPAATSCALPRSAGGMVIKG